MDFNELSLTQMIVYGICFLGLGYLILLGMIYMLPKKLRSENDDQRNDVLQKAKRLREKVLTENLRRDEQKLALKQEEFDTEIEGRNRDLQESEEELNILAETVAQAEARLTKQAQDLAQKKAKLQSLIDRYDETRQKLSQSIQAHREALEQSNPDLDIEAETRRIRDNITNTRSLSVQKAMKDYQDELNTHATRLATRMLGRISARYAPDFVWPKSSYLVEIKDPKIADLLASNQHPLIQDLIELAEDVTISLTTDKEDFPLGIKLVGGYGIYKEAAKLTLDTVLNRGPQEWSRAGALYKQHERALQQKALQLGREAVAQLGLKGMHDEILKMVGALNWRTSYRQNQYLHSVEVATLAGIVATELGLDPDIAKRCGLLHDIGKGIDYRIEGSHAVISGDYADRFGEGRLICDTVMSHHNDLVLETPMSYVLKTADTLSGARPGARVNIEEGYQIRLSAIDQVVKSFRGILKVAIMSGGREVHVEVAHNKVRENELETLASSIARKIEEDVAYPGQIKVLVSRRFEATAVA